MEQRRSARPWFADSQEVVIRSLVAAPENVPASLPSLRIIATAEHRNALKNKSQFD
jgi:hypothetical protein